MQDRTCTTAFDQRERKIEALDICLGPYMMGISALPKEELRKPYEVDMVRRAGGY